MQCCSIRRSNQLEARTNARPITARNPPSANGYSTKVHHFFIKRKKVIGCVNASVYVSILPSVVECQHTEWRWGVPIFADSRQKSVTIATSLERRRKEGRIDHAHPLLLFFYPRFNKLLLLLLFLLLLANVNVLRYVCYMRSQFRLSSVCLSVVCCIIIIIIIQHLYSAIVSYAGCRGACGAS